MSQLINTDFMDLISKYKYNYFKLLYLFYPQVLTDEFKKSPKVGGINEGGK